MQQHLANREQKEFGNEACIVDKEDIEFIVTELWHAKCAATGEHMERVPTAITRWRAASGDGLDNYVLLQSHLAVKLDAAQPKAAGKGEGGSGGGPEAVFDASTVARVEKVLKGVRAVGERFKLH